MSAAVFTLVRNESEWLPVWAHYYARHIPPADIYVLDHDSTDASVERVREVVPLNVEKVTNPRFHDEKWRMALVTCVLGELLESYDKVLYVDADEFVVPDPWAWPKGLGEYLARFDRDVVSCSGRSVLQKRDELGLDLDSPVLGQRHWWKADPSYSKPALSRTLVHRDFGAHALREGEPPVLRDPHLYMLHLAKADYGIRRKRLQALHAELGDSLEERLERWGSPPLMNWQWLLRDDQFDDWFYGDAAEPIPRRFYALV